MVNGVKMVFMKELMLKRVEAEGRMCMVGPVELAIMDNLDGREVTTASWARRVHGAPVYSCIGRDGNTYDVYEGDCAAL